MIIRPKCTLRQRGRKWTWSICPVSGHRVLAQEFPRLRLYAHKAIWRRDLDDASYEYYPGLGYTITEERTGLRIGSGATLHEAVEEARRQLQNRGEDAALQQIDKVIRKYGFATEVLNL